MSEATKQEPRVEIGCHERIAGALIDFCQALVSQPIQFTVGQGEGEYQVLAALQEWATDCDLTLDGAWTDGRWVQEEFKHALVMDPTVTKEQLHFWLCQASDEERKNLDTLVDHLDIPTPAYHWVSFYGSTDHIALATEVPDGKTFCGREVKYHKDWPLVAEPPVSGTCVVCRAAWDKHRGVATGAER